MVRTGSFPTVAEHRTIKYVQLQLNLILTPSALYYDSRDLTQPLIRSICYMSVLITTVIKLVDVVLSNFPKPMNL